MTSKQRAYLRSLANPLEAVLTVGKQGASPETVAALDEALTARELVKINVLPNCDITPREAAETLSGRTRAECVQVIGRKIVLYRPSKDKPKIELPKK